MSRSPGSPDGATATGPAASSTIVRYIEFADGVSTFVGKAASWLVGVLMLLVCIEVIKRYLLNAPTSEVFDISSMLYGGCFMLCGAYALAQNAHVRGDFLYGSFRPRTQAALDLALYLLFFLPGILALCFSGWDFAHQAWTIHEHSNTTADGPPVYHFKTLIPIAGVLVLLQGTAEIVRCAICLKTGAWPPRLADAEETDVVEQQLAAGTHVDEDARREVIRSIESIDEAAHARARGLTHE